MEAFLYFRPGFPKGGHPLVGPGRSAWRSARSRRQVRDIRDKVAVGAHQHDEYIIDIADPNLH